MPISNINFKIWFLEIEEQKKEGMEKMKVLDNASKSAFNIYPQK